MTIRKHKLRTPADIETLRERYPGPRRTRAGGSMSKATMPSPAIWIQSNHINQVRRGPFLARISDRQEQSDWKALYTPTQVEAYADAKVREALEEAANIAFNAPITADMMDDDSAKALAFHAASRIRALIPKEPT